MNVAELFVKLGVQGGDKTLGTLKDNQKAFKGTASMALEAKAAIFGAVYALQSLFRTSNNLGSDLTNFNAVLGVSAQTLQKYQYAARQVGVDNKAVEQSFRTLQAAMTKTLMNGDAPKGLARVAQLTGDITPEDLLEFSKAPEKLLQRLQEYAAKEKDAGFRNEVLKTFGLGDDIIAALSRKAFTSGALAKAPTYSEKEIASLDRANVAWANLGNKIEMAIGKFNAKYGTEFVAGLTDITGKVINLADAFVRFSEKAKLLHWVGEAVRGWVMIFEELTRLIDYLSEKLPKLWDAAPKFFSETLPSVYRKFTEEMDKTRSFMPTLVPQKPSIYDDRYKSPEMIADRNWGVEMEKRRQFAEDNGYAPVQKRPTIVELVVPTAPAAAQRDAAIPKMPALAGAQPTPAVNNQNITVNQTLNFEGSAGSDIEKIKRVHGQAVQQALRQNPAQARSN